jgi:SAM-dependent methyltransferase
MSATNGLLASAAGRDLFGRDARSYAIGRPGYPETVYEILESRCHLGAGTATLEIGPGGGQATRELLRRGARPLTLVEPDASFANYLREQLGTDLEIVAESFETAPLPRTATDLLVSATAFHWVQPQRTGLAKSFDVLKPGGWWSAWWNIYRDPTRADPLTEALAPIFEPLPKVGAGEFALSADARRADLRACGFSEVDVELMHWQIRVTADASRALYATYASVLALPPFEQERVLDRIATTIESTFGGSVERTITTVMYTARRAN